MRRFFLDQDGVCVGCHALLSRTESHHLRDVLRLRCGSQVRLFCRGREYTATIDGTSGEQVRVLVTGECDAITAPRISIHAVIPLLKGGRTEDVVHQLTELGIASIGVFRARRAVAELTTARTERMLRVVIAACKQCRRCDQPDLAMYASLGEAIDAHGFAPPFSLLLYEEERALKLTEALTKAGLTRTGSHPAGPVLLASGPEGGFADDEVAAVRNRATPVGLGPRILRAETAPVTAVAAALAIAGAI